MSRTWDAFAALCLLIACSGAVRAQSTCAAKGVMAGLPFTLTECVVTHYDHSVALWFSEKPLLKEEADLFRMSSYADYMKRDAQGGRRTMLAIAFCQPTGPKAAPSAVKSVELGVEHAKAASLGPQMLGPQQQWVFELPKDKAFVVKSLSGEIKSGGRVTGVMTGSTKGGGQPFTWQITFDVVLPEKPAGAGLGCSG